MKIKDIVCTREVNAKIIRKHNVDREEVQSVFENYHFDRKVKKDRYLALGSSYSGKYLAVFFAFKNGTARIITAREMNTSEKRLFRKKRGLKK